MKRYKLNLTNNPSFNTVLNLTNRTFDGTTIVTGRGATEDQLLVIYNMIKEIQDFLDEQGCSDDPWVYLRQKVDELEAAQEACCNTDWSAGTTQYLQQKITELDQQITNCCSVDHGGGAVADINARLDQLEAQITACCNAMDQRTQDILDNIGIYNGDGGASREISIDCGDGAIEVNYHLDTSGTWTAVTDNAKIVGRVTANVITPGKVPDKYFFIVKKANGDVYTTGGLATYVTTVKIDGHRDIAFTINDKFGDISMRYLNSGIEDADYTSSVITDCCGNPIVGSTRQYTRLFAVIIDTDQCRWETEIPLSAFDFSGIDESHIVSHHYCPCNWMITPISG